MVQIIITDAVREVYKKLFPKPIGERSREMRLPFGVGFTAILPQLRLISLLPNAPVIVFAAQCMGKISRSLHAVASFPAHEVRPMQVQLEIALLFYGRLIAAVAHHKMAVEV